MCKGTTNFEDVYLIKVDHLPQNRQDKLGSRLWLNHHGGIPVDQCIGKEIETLINYGVTTVGCCCGHGERKPSALVTNDSRDKLFDLGYLLYEYSEEHTDQGIYEIELKFIEQ
jgi:hypothetical protein